MPILIESKHALVVEKRGHLVFVFAVLLAILHFWVLWNLIDNLEAVSREAWGYAAMAISFLVYVGLGYVGWGPLSDRRTVTIDASKARVTFDREYPFGWKMQNAVPYSEIDAIEISPPEAGGFCRLRLKDGKRLTVARIGRGDDFKPFERLELFAGKPVERIS